MAQTDLGGRRRGQREQRECGTTGRERVALETLQRFPPSDSVAHHPRGRVAKVGEGTLTSRPIVQVPSRAAPIVRHPTEQSAPPGVSPWCPHIHRKEEMMSHRVIGALAALALLAGGAGTALADDGHHGDGNDNAKVLKSDLFGSMPDGPVLFGVKPGGAPWVIDKGEAEARRDGSVKVKVEGLIIPTTGTNPAQRHRRDRLLQRRRGRHHEGVSVQRRRRRRTGRSRPPTSRRAGSDSQEALRNRRHRHRHVEETGARCSYAATGVVVLAVGAFALAYFVFFPTDSPEKFSLSDGPRRPPPRRRPRPPPRPTGPPSGPSPTARRPATACVRSSRSCRPRTTRSAAPRRSPARRNRPATATR